MLKEILVLVEWKKVSGSIPTKILKLAAKECSPVLTNCFNGSIIHNSEFPDQLSLADVIPLHKKGSSTDKGNYRPISLLPAFSKVFERLTLRGLIFAGIYFCGINFRVDLFSRFCDFEYFAGIYFRGFSTLKNFAGFYFRVSNIFAISRTAKLPNLNFRCLPNRQNCRVQRGRHTPLSNLPPPYTSPHQSLNFHNDNNGKRAFKIYFNFIFRGFQIYKNFAGINFRGWPLSKNFAGIYFRGSIQNRENKSMRKLIPAKINPSEN